MVPNCTITVTVRSTISQLIPSPISNLSILLVDGSRLAARRLHRGGIANRPTCQYSCGSCVRIIAFPCVIIEEISESSYLKQLGGCTQIWPKGMGDALTIELYDIRVRGSVVFRTCFEDLDGKRLFRHGRELIGSTAFLK